MERNARRVLGKQPLGRLRNMSGGSGSGERLLEDLVRATRLTSPAELPVV
ncbi:hypothetical protein [Streptomyces prasinus]